MKKTGIAFAILAVALVGIVAALYYYSGDIGVSNSISNIGISICTPPTKAYSVKFTMTNYNVTNATTINATSQYTILDNYQYVVNAYKSRVLTVGESYTWVVNKCTVGNSTNHTIMSNITLVDPQTDSNPENNFASATMNI